MKVKIFVSKLGLKYLENEINSFLDSFYKEDIIDIKIQTSDKITLAMVIYRSN